MVHIILCRQVHAGAKANSDSVCAKSCQHSVEITYHMTFDYKANEQKKKIYIYRLLFYFYVPLFYSYSKNYNALG